jgi:AcrR family transcriptional regulator
LARGAERRNAPQTEAAKAARSVSARVRLAGGELHELRHVCGLFAGVEDTYAALLPFIAEGLQAGQRAVHLVGPVARASHLERLASAGIDVEGTLDTGQLEVATWEDSYLRGGRFDRMGMLLSLQKTLSEGRSRGYPVTRAIGFMEWALEGVAGVENVVAYEADLDTSLRGRPDSVICAYDLSRHPAGLVAQLQATHPLAVVGGKLSPTGVTAASPRVRILDSASYLFSRYGIGPTGVDALIDAAGVAKRTFYRYFPSKDDLIVAWLSDGRTHWLDRVRRRAEEIASGPDETIPAFFDAVAEWLEAEDYRGCPYLNTAVELGDPDHPAHPVIRAYLSEVRQYLKGLLRSTAHPEPMRVAGQLQALIAGAITLSVVMRSSAPVAEARDAAISIAGSGRG